MRRPILSHSSAQSSSLGIASPTDNEKKEPGVLLTPGHHRPISRSLRNKRSLPPIPSHLAEQKYTLTSFSLLHWKPETKNLCISAIHIKALGSKTSRVAERTLIMVFCDSEDATSAEGLVHARESWNKSQNCRFHVKTNDASIIDFDLHHFSLLMTLHLSSDIPQEKAALPCFLGTCVFRDH